MDKEKHLSGVGSKNEGNDENTVSMKLSFKEVLVMILLTINPMASMYLIQIPGSLQNALMKYYNLSISEYSLFGSIYALSSSIFSVVGGRMVDSTFGLRKTTYIFSIVILMGSALFAAGGPLNSFVVILIGNFILGAGQGVIFSGVNFRYTMYWFRDTYAGLLFSLQDNIGNAGVLMAFAFSTRILHWVSHDNPNKQYLDITLIIAQSVSIIVVLTIVAVTLMKPTRPQDLTVKGERPSFIQCLKFPASYWVMTFAYTTFYNAVYVFEDFSQVMLMQEFNMTAIESSSPVTVMNITKLILAFPAGLIISKFGRNLTFLIFSITLPLISHIILVLKVNPSVCLGIMGVGFSFTAAALWPMFGYILNETNYGLGIGLLTGIIFVAQFVYELIVGKIIDNYGYIWVQIYFIIVLAIGILSLLCLKFFGKGNNLILDMPASQRKMQQ